MHKKMLYVGAIIFAGLMITSVAVASLQPLEKEHKLVVKNLEHCIAGMKMMKAKTLNPIIRHFSTGILDGTPLYNGYTPTLATDTSNVCLGFQDDQTVWFTGSVDGGAYWPENAVGYQIEELPEGPDVDACGDGRFLGTMVPNPMDCNGGALYKWQITDLTDFSSNGYGLVYWDWSSIDIANFVDVSVGAYTAADPTENTWAFGAHTMQGDNSGVGPQPLLSYQFNEEGYAWIYWFNDDPANPTIAGGESTSADIDPVTLHMYGVWNFFNEETGLNDILIYIFDFGSWDEYQGYPIHPDIGGYALMTSGSDNSIDVSAQNNNVIIVSERDDQIVSYSSTFGFSDEPVETIIDTGGSSPRVSHYDDNSATCVYVKDGALYTSFTTDGGRTWSTPVKQSGSEDVIIGDVGSIGMAYEADGIIYYAAGGGNYPIIQIGDVTGGFGVQVEISNTGTGDADDLSYSITATGGLLGFINKQTIGTIDIPAGTTQKVKLPIIIGLGKITIDITAGSASKTVHGTQILIYTLL